MSEIVVGVDGSVGSENALRWAVGEARLRSATVRAVLAWAHGAHRHAMTERFDADDVGDLTLSADQLLHETVRRTPLGDPPVEIRETVVDRPPVDALVDESHDALMLVVGARGRSRLRRMVVGSVSGACVHEATCPVVVVHGHVDAKPDPRPVLVGVDGSAPSIGALRQAAGEAAMRGVPLSVVHAWTAELSAYAGFYPLIDSVSMEKAAQTVLDDCLDKASLRDRDAPEVDARLAYGPTARTLIKAAEFAQLLVLGARGHGGFAELLLGSTGHQCLTHAPCPVMLIGGRAFDAETDAETDADAGRAGGMA
jgi:nucleotide-binding universal stress UspA family protein